MAAESTYTITFSRDVENHYGNQIIHSDGANTGLTYEELKLAKVRLHKLGINSEIIKLHKYISDYDSFPNEEKNNVKAYILFAKRSINKLLNVNLLKSELELLEWDKKALMRGVVKNKIARYNLCFADHSQDADYANGKGTVYSFSYLPQLSKIREEIGNIFGQKYVNLLAEGNNYYDYKKCYIGYHGDAERKIVIGVRLGKPIPLYYKWYKNGNLVDMTVEKIKIEFEDHAFGDLYAMSVKATGNDWKKRKIYTLRHAVGWKF